MKTNYSAEIARTIKAYEAYRAKCKELEKKALELLEHTIASFDTDFDVFCSYIPGDGLSFTIDTGHEELTMTCTQFFHMFKKNEYGNITLDMIKNYSY